MALFDGFAPTPDWARGSYVSSDVDDGRVTSVPVSLQPSIFSRLSTIDEGQLIAACQGGACGRVEERLPREELEALDQKLAGVGSGTDEDFIHHLDRLIKKYSIKLPVVQVMQVIVTLSHSLGSLTFTASMVSIQDRSQCCVIIASYHACKLPMVPCMCASWGPGSTAHGSMHIPWLILTIKCQETSRPCWRSLTSHTPDHACAG